jgi:hypothetical protein
MIPIWNSPDYEVTVDLTRREDVPYVVTDTRTNRQVWVESCGEAVRIAEDIYKKTEEIR